MSSRISALLIALITCICLVAAAASNDGDNKPDAPLSEAGRTAIQKFSAAQAKADAAYKLAMTAALKVECADLDKALQGAMKANNLDEAERCKKMKDAAQAKLAGLQVSHDELADLRAAVIKQKMYTYNYGGLTRPMEFLPNGTIGAGGGQLEKTWKAEIIGGQPAVVIAGSSGPMELLRQDDGSFAGEPFAKGG